MTFPIPIPSDWTYSIYLPVYLSIPWGLTKFSCSDPGNLFSFGAYRTVPRRAAASSGVGRPRPSWRCVSTRSCGAQTWRPCWWPCPASGTCARRPTSAVAWTRCPYRPSFPTTTLSWSSPPSATWWRQVWGFYQITESMNVNSPLQENYQKRAAIALCVCPSRSFSLTEASNGFAQEDRASHCWQHWGQGHGVTWSSFI